MKSSASQSKPFQSRQQSKFPAGLRGKNGWTVPIEIGVPNWSDAELFIYLIQCIRFGSWKIRRLNRA